MSIPVFSLDHVRQRADLMAALRGVVDRQRYILGPEVADFERQFARYCGVEHCVGVANGTDALEIALRALDVGPGSRVAVVANAGHYGSTAVRALGATPVYVDVSPSTRTMAPDHLATALTHDLQDLHDLQDVQDLQDLAAIIVTHLYGQLADMPAILAHAREAGVPVVEDCAQAHGAESEGRRAGAFGDIGCFSFYPTKNLGALGDAGAIVTADPVLATRARQLRQYGWDEKYHVALPGGRNSRLDELQAAVLTAKLPYLDDWNADRRDVARRYVDGLAGLPARMPAIDESHVAHLFVIEVEGRDALAEHLRRQGVESAVHYPVADHRQTAYFPDGPTADLPVTDALTSTVLTLPCFPGLAPADQDAVIGAVRSFFDGREG